MFKITDFIFPKATAVSKEQPAEFCLCCNRPNSRGKKAPHHLESLEACKASKALYNPLQKQSPLCCGGCVTKKSKTEITCGRSSAKA